MSQDKKEPRELSMVSFIGYWSCRADLSTYPSDPKDNDEIKFIELSAFKELQARCSELEWFAAQINKYVMHGEADTQDAALIAFKELQARCEKLESAQKELATLMDSLIWACDNHLSSVGMTFSSKTILREKLEAIQAWIETREALASKETMNGK